MQRAVRHHRHPQLRQRDVGRGGGPRDRPAGDCMVESRRMRVACARIVYRLLACCSELGARSSRIYQHFSHSTQSVERTTYDGG